MPYALGYIALLMLGAPIILGAWTYVVDDVVNREHRLTDRGWVVAMLVLLATLATYAVVMTVLPKPYGG
jgi:hypothetical protein